MNDKAFRLLLDLWMINDKPGHPIGERLDEVCRAECKLRGVDIVDAYHAATP